MLYAHFIYGIAEANQIWLTVLPLLAGRGQWKVRDEPVRHFLNDLVVGAVRLNGACVIALRGNTARNVSEGHIIKTSTTDQLLVFVLFPPFYVERLMNGYGFTAVTSVISNANQCLHGALMLSTKQFKNNILITVQCHFK